MRIKEKCKKSKELLKKKDSESSNKRKEDKLS